MKNIFLDCGAWNGCSTNFFRANYPDADIYEVFCFDALPENVNELNKLADVTVIDKAVGGTDGSMRFYKGLTQSGSLFIEKTTGEVDKNNWIDVDVLGLSKWIKDNFSPEDNIILKLNVEGAEYKIIEQMFTDDTLKYIDKFYIQWHWNKINLPESEHNRIKALLPKTSYKWGAMLNKVDELKNTL